MLAVALRSLSAVATAGLLASAYHKVRLVSSGRHKSMPIFKAGSWSARHSLLLTAVAGCAELALAITLLVEPAWGFAAVIPLLAVYAAYLARLAPSAPCDCFGGLLPEPRRNVALTRNAALAVICAFASCAYFLDWTPVRPIDATAAGAALIFVAMVAAWALRPRAANPYEGTAAPITRSTWRH